MEELTNFQVFTRRILYLVGWLIHQISGIFTDKTSGSWTIKGFVSPLIWLTFGLFFAFAALHIFKRILRKG